MRIEIQDPKRELKYALSHLIDLYLSCKGTDVEGTATYEFTAEFLERHNIDILQENDDFCESEEEYQNNIIKPQDLQFNSPTRGGE